MRTSTSKYILRTERKEPPFTKHQLCARHPLSEHRVKESWLGACALEPDNLGEIIQCHHLPAVWLWTGGLTSLFLSVYICKQG